MISGCLGLFSRLVVEALAVRAAQGIIKWVSDGHLRNVLAAILALVGIRLK
jgi:hypothetical protein